MDILQHPAYQSEGEVLVDKLRRDVVRFRRLRPVAFLCGKERSTNRDLVRDYLARHHPDLLVFYAEHVWEHLSNRVDLNALAMEEQLAKLSDVVILIVESPGTIAELGAFSLSERLREKLLPLLSDEFRADKSFINTGPVAWVDRDSAFRPSIHTNFKAILTCMPEVESRLTRIDDRPSRSTPFEISLNPKQLLFFLCDLLAIIGPATRPHCEWYFGNIFRDRPQWSTEALLGLAKSLNLVGSYHSEVLEDLVYYRMSTEAALERFRRGSRYSTERDRVRFLAVYQRIPGLLNEFAARTRSAP